MKHSLSPAKVVLLAVDLAVQVKLDLLDKLASQYRDILGQDLLFRVLLTYLPETTPPSSYVTLIGNIARGEFNDESDIVLETAFVDSLTEEQAANRARKLHLLHLSRTSVPEYADADPLELFLINRAYQLDEEAGLLDQVPKLVEPFLDHGSFIRHWVAYTVLPVLRRNSQNHTQDSKPYSLRQFQTLDDGSAAKYLLAQMGQNRSAPHDVGQELRGLISPWLHHQTRWAIENSSDASSELFCAGWQQVLEWLVLQASTDWQVAVNAFEQWSGPCDGDFGDGVVNHTSACPLGQVRLSYAKAGLASAYLVSEASLEALNGAYRIINRAKSILNLSLLPPIDLVADERPAIASEALPQWDSNVVAHLRSNLLEPSNPLTEPSLATTDFLSAIVLSAFILTRLGIPSSVRKASNLALLQDRREQKNELTKLIRHILNQAPRGDDQYWIQARLQILWLRNWGADQSHTDANVRGIFGKIPREEVEVELLKSMLSNMRYTLVKTIYEDAEEKFLADQTVQDAVECAALDAFDNASNPNRTRGGLKKCNDINQALSKIVPPSLATRKKVEALLSATHALSAYRLVLKQGEPFTPVMLRVHSDPISIIERVLDQNTGAYTRLQEFIEVGIDMVDAGLLAREKSSARHHRLYNYDEEVSYVEKRIISMCISAALREDDFETAYSYVVSRLGHPEPTLENDSWSWRAALAAGQYVRTSKSQQPTHLGTSSGNPEIRHLEQRLECLSAALRVAPVESLQGVLESFRQCEELLELAISDEAAEEAAWDIAGDLQDLPGSFDNLGPEKGYPSRNATASASSRQLEEAPMSLFDLSRATAGVAQRNFTALSSLRGLAQGAMSSTHSKQQDQVEDVRVRKRDQLREAATGTLVSGVGWLIGANVNAS